MLQKSFIPVNESKWSECVFVAKVIASSIETLLGNGKSLKCCESSGTSILTGSTPKILETIDIQHPAGFIINSACQSFQKEFGCGSATLACVIGYWAGALQDLADLGVPTTVIVGVLDEIVDELENVLQRSCISLRTVQDISVDDPMFHQNVSSQDQDPLKSTCHVFDEYVEYSGEICDENTTYIKDDSVDNVGLLAANVNENHVSLRTSQSFNKTDFLPHANITKVDSQLCQSSTYSASKDLSVDGLSSTCKETQKDVVEDEFECCFDGLTIGEETPRNVGRSFLTSSSKPCNDNIMKTLARKKQSPLFGEVSFGKSNSELNNDTLLNRASISHGCGLNLKQKNGNRYSGNHNLSKNDSELLNISRKRSIHRDSINEVFARKTIHTIMDVKNVLLRSRHLTCQTTREPSTLSQTHDDINRNLGSGCNKVGNNSSSLVSTENYEHKVEQSYFNIDHEPRKDEPESSYLVACQRDEYWLNHLGRSLDHGKENEMSLALEILKKQFTSSEKPRRKFSFQLDAIGVQTVLGPPVCNSCVLEGAVVGLSKENQCIVARDIDTPRQIALVQDDISYNYRHPGFKDSVQVTHTLNKDDFCNSSLNAQSKWIERVMLLIKSLNLGVVAVHGRMTSVLRDNLQALGVIVLENLSSHQLDVLSKMTGTSVVSYILDLTAYDLGKPVMIRIWDSGWSSGRHSATSNGIQTFVFGQISLWCDEQFQNLNSVLYSVVLCGSVQDLVNDSELKFWNCVHRLRNAIDDQCVLPGGGDIEIICVKHLEDIRDCRPPAKALLSRWIQDDYNEFRPLIFEAICSGLKQFVARTNSNIGMVSTHQCSSISDRSAMETSQTIYDNYSCKVEGWKRAIRIVKLLLNTEYHIITGL